MGKTYKKPNRNSAGEHVGTTRTILFLAAVGYLLFAVIALNKGQIVLLVPLGFMAVIIFGGIFLTYVDTAQAFIKILIIIMTVIIVSILFESLGDKTFSNIASVLGISSFIWLVLEKFHEGMQGE